MTRPQARTVAPDLDPGFLTIDPEPEPSAEALKDRISTWLSTVALVAMAGGVGWGVWPWLGPFAVAVGGGLLALFVVMADAGRKPVAVTAERPGRGPVPGPTDAGMMHAKGPGATS